MLCSMTGYNDKCSIVPSDRAWLLYRGASGAERAFTWDIKRRRGRQRRRLSAKPCLLTNCTNSMDELHPEHTAITLGRLIKIYKEDRRRVLNLSPLTQTISLLVSHHHRVRYRD